MESANHTPGKYRPDLETRLYQFIGQFDGFYTHPPLHHRKLYVGDDLMMFLNDGFDIYIGTADKWTYSYRHKEFRQFALSKG